MLLQQQSRAFEAGRFPRSGGRPVRRRTLAREEEELNQIDMGQRLEELQLAVRDTFASPKVAAVRSYDEGDTIYILVSWVSETGADTTLDSRCAVTIRFARSQIERYAAFDTARRKEIQARFSELVRTTFEAKRSAQPNEGECAVEFAVPDSLMEIRDEPYSPSL
jgi:hypothetical protein